MTQPNSYQPEEETMTENNSSAEVRLANQAMQRSAAWGAYLLAAAGLAFFVFAISIVSFTDWEDYILVGFPLVLAGMSLASIFIMRRGRLALGSGIVFSLNLIVPLLIIFIIRDTLWTALLYAAVSSALIIWRALPYRSWRWSIIAAVAVMVLIVVIDINAPTRFDSPPAFNTFVVLLISVLVVAFVIQAVRQTWGRSMRNKLLVAFIGLTVISAIALGVPVITETTRFLEGNMERELTALTVERAILIGEQLNAEINAITTLSLNKGLQQALEAKNNSYEGNTSDIQLTLDTRDATWRAADEANNNNNPLVRENLTNTIAGELALYQQTFPDNVEVFLTDVYGGLAGTTNRTSDYYQADEGWWQAAYNNNEGAVYISEPEFDESANAAGVQIAIPVRNNDGDIIGVLRTTYVVSALETILENNIGETGSNDLFIPGETTLHIHEGNLEEALPGLFEQLQAARDLGQGMVELDYEGTLSVVTQAPVQTLLGNPTIDNLGWVVAFHQHRDEAFSQINGQVQGVIFVMLIVAVIAIVAAFVLAQFLVRPITNLTVVAEAVAAGNLDSRAEVTTVDEIGLLASTFNSMTSQLQETLQGLEERVAARTRDLEIVAEVGTATSTILESKRLLQEVVDLTKERFNLYHSHIYLLDEQGENLVLAAGAGEPGRIMVAEGRSIPLNSEQSLVARAARDRQGITVNDVTQAPDHLPNPLLPDTRSELAVPMVVGGNVIGVFDIQSEQVGRFTDTDVNIQTTLASQLATSIQNVRSFERSQKEAELQSLVNVIGSRIQRTTSIEETLQTAIRELGTAIGATRVKANVGQNNGSSRPTAAD